LIGRKAVVAFYVFGSAANRDDLRITAFVERYPHLSIEEVLDIANHFVSFYQWREPAGYRKRLADFDLFMGLIMDWTARQKENI